MNKALIALSLMSVANVAMAAKTNNECKPGQPAPCNADDCCRTYCLGPENYGVNAPVLPVTCNGDIVISVAGFYWNAHQDGMEYAIDSAVANPDVANQGAALLVASAVQELNNVISGEYLTPHFEWDFGFKLGLGYNSPCDGWDIGVLWTWYRGKANDHVEAEIDDNHTLLPLWSAFSPTQGSVLYATDIESHWKLKLNLIDIELGRKFWTSRYLSIRPFVGVRVALIDQKFDLENKGGSYGSRIAAAFAGDTIFGAQDAFNNYVTLDNEFKGAGLRAGLDSEWNFGCGWALFGNFAGSIVYGKFTVEHDEYNREATAPHDKTKVLETEDNFRASRGMLDLALGLQWSTVFCQCNYGLTVQLAWENHLFFNQNQFWRVSRIADGGATALPNNTGENLFQQRRGDLDTQGWTLKLIFDF